MLIGVSECSDSEIAKNADLYDAMIQTVQYFDGEGIRFCVVR